MDYEKIINDLDFERQNISVRDESLLDAIDNALMVLREVADAESVMPTKHCNSDEEERDGWYNRAIDSCILTHAKVVGELKEIIRAHKAEALMGNIPYKEAIALKNENAELKEKLKKYETRDTYTIVDMQLGDDSQLKKYEDEK